MKTKPACRTGRLRMKIKGDENLDPALAEEVQGVRGIILGEAESNPLPKRFTAQAASDGPYMYIVDNETNRTTKVPLFAYGETRRVLTELFG